MYLPYISFQKETGAKVKEGVKHKGKEKTLPYIFQTLKNLCRISMPCVHGVDTGKWGAEGLKVLK